MKSPGSLTGYIPVRAAAAAGFIAVVVGVLLIARMIDDSPSATTESSTVSRPTSTAAPFETPSAAQPGTGVASSASGHPDDNHDDGVQDFPVAPSAPAAPAAVATVTNFAGAWLRRDLATEQWWAGVAGYCEPGFAERLRTAVPGDGSSGRITGPVTPVTSRADFAVFQVPTDGGILQISVALLGGAWKVTTTDWRRP